jgi:hypothetical protein
MFADHRNLYFLEVAYYILFCVAKGKGKMYSYTRVIFCNYVMSYSTSVELVGKNGVPM